jgi:hypothetical protein
MKTPQHPPGVLPVHAPIQIPRATAGRQSRIHALIDQIQRGEGFNAADLAAALGMRAWTAYQQEKQSMPRPPMAGQVAAELSRYREVVRRADAMARATMEKRKRVNSRKQRLMLGYAVRSATGEYERALELLEQLADDWPGIAGYFDRPLNFGQSGDLTPSPCGVPRLHGSRSENAAAGGAEAKSLALTYLRRALADLDLSRL